MRNGIIFGTTTGEPIVQEICEILDVKPGRRQLSRFRNGEIRLRIEDNVREMDVFIVGPIGPPAEKIEEMILLARTAAMASATRVTLIPTIFTYDRQERRTQSREPISAKYIADKLKLSAAKRALLFDIHADAIVGFFEPEMTIDHLYGSVTMIPYLRTIMKSPFTVASPDAGGVPRALKYAQYLGVPAREVVIFSKDRPEPGVVNKDAIQIIGNVKGKNLLFIDDMIDSGGTIIADAKAAKKQGARDIYVCAAHGLFTEGLDVFPQGLFKEIIVTNSVNCGSVAPTSPNVKITQCSIAPLLARAIRRIHDGRSISELFL